MNETGLIQLELGMNPRRSNYRNARQDRLVRARWWFNKMRQVVNLAPDQRAACTARPEQTYLTLAPAGRNSFTLAGQPRTLKAGRR